MHFEFGIGLVQRAWVLDELPPNRAGAGKFSIKVVLGTRRSGKNSIYL